MQPASGVTSASFRFLCSPEDRVVQELMTVEAERAPRFQNNPDGSLEVYSVRGNTLIPGLTVGKDIQWRSSASKHEVGVIKLHRAPYTFVKSVTSNCSCRLALVGSNEKKSFRIDGFLNNDFFDTSKKVKPLTVDALSAMDLCVAEDSARKLHLLVLRPNCIGKYTLTDYSEKK